jgi:hypothetical protein
MAGLVSPFIFMTSTDREKDKEGLRRTIYGYAIKKTKRTRRHMTHKHTSTCLERRCEGQKKEGRRSVLVYFDLGKVLVEAFAMTAKVQVKPRRLRPQALIKQRIFPQLGFRMN